MATCSAQDRECEQQCRDVEWTCKNDQCPSGDSACQAECEAKVPGCTHVCYLAETRCLNP
jgi:hypothetical protein